MSLTPGTRVGQYEILSALGAGGMGEVYRARDSRLNRDVAIKVLPAGLAQDPAALARFEREAQAVAALSHPNILAIHDFGADRGIAFAVTELLEGDTLRARLADGALPVRKAVEFATQIVHGISAAHERGIVHRDLKPENIFVTRAGVVKILDFGLAKSAADSRAGDAAETKVADTTPGMVLGTVGYMSPEQVRGLAVDHRSDIFSFGAVFYEMLTGRRPFRGDSQVETMNAILKEDPPEFSGITANLPGGLERIILRCLEKQPDERFHSAHDLGIALEALSGTTHQNSASISLSGAAMGEPANAGRQPSWQPSLVAAAAVVLIVGAAAFFAGRALSTPTPVSPDMTRLTFRRGPIWAGRMTPDGKTYVYSATWEGTPQQLYSVRADSPESQPLPYTNANLVSISSKGELAIIRDRTGGFSFASRGTLARASLSGAAMRDVLEDVQDADWMPNGDDLAVSRVVDGKYQLEFPIGKIVYQTGGWMSHIRVSPDGQRIAFLDQPAVGDDRGTAAIIDGSGKKTSMNIDCASTQGIAWAPSGQEVWFTCAVKGSARELLAGSLDGQIRTVLRVPGALFLLDVGSDGSVLLSHENTRFGLKGLAPGETRERDLSWLDWGLPTQLSDDGRTVLFSEQSEGGGPGYSVYVRGTNGTPAIRLGTGLANALSADGKWVIASDLSTSPTQLVLMPTGAGQPRKLTNDDIAHVNVRFLPDGKNFVFNGFKPGKPISVWRQPLEGGEAVPVMPEGIRSQSITTDGTRIVGRAPDGGRKIYRIDQEGIPPEPLRGFQRGDLLLRFSGDDRNLYFYRKDAGDGSADVFRLDIASGARTKMYTIIPSSDTVSLGGVNSLFLSADGKAYVYVYSTWQSDLFLVKGLR